MVTRVKDRQAPHHYVIVKGTQSNIEGVCGGGGGEGVGSIVAVSD